MVHCGWFVLASVACHVIVILYGQLRKVSTLKVLKVS